MEKNSSKTERLIIKLTKEEKEFIDLISETLNISKSEVGRNLLFYGFITANYYKYLDDIGGLSRIKELTNNDDFEKELKNFINERKLNKDIVKGGERDDE